MSVVIFPSSTKLALDEKQAQLESLAARRAVIAAKLTEIARSEHGGEMIKNLGFIYNGDNPGAVYILENVSGGDQDEPGRVLLYFHDSRDMRAVMAEVGLNQVAVWDGGLPVSNYHIIDKNQPFLGHKYTGVSEGQDGLMTPERIAMVVAGFTMIESALKIGDSE